MSIRVVLTRKTSSDPKEKVHPKGEMVYVADGHLFVSEVAGSMSVDNTIGAYAPGEWRSVERVADDA